MNTKKSRNKGVRSRYKDHFFDLEEGDRIQIAGTIGVLIEKIEADQALISVSSDGEVFRNSQPLRVRDTYDLDGAIRLKYLRKKANKMHMRLNMPREYGYDIYGKN